MCGSAGVCAYVHLGCTGMPAFFACTPAFPNQRACVHVRGGLEDYKEEVNGKYTLGDKVRDIPLLPLPSPYLFPLSLPSLHCGRVPGKIKQVVWAWQESWLGPGWAGLQAAGGYQKLLGPALGQYSEWPRASLSCEFWELPQAPSNTSELPIWCSLGN